MRCQSVFYTIICGLLNILIGLRMQAEALPANDGLSYTVDWKGPKKHEAADSLKAFSRVEALQKVPPASLPLLQRRLDQDITRLQGVLQAKGYYEATISGRIDTQTLPVTVIFTFLPGPRYQIGRIEIVYPPGHPSREPWQPLLKKSDPASAAFVRNEENRMRRHFQQTGHPDPVITEQQYVIDPASKTMNLYYEIDPGLPRRFGVLETEGLLSLNPKYIRRQTPWEAGDIYDIRLIEDFEKQLVLTGLFSRARITLQPEADQAEAVDLRLAVTERYHRTIRLGVNYHSDVGFGAISSWEHRNIFGRGERLKIDALVAQEESLGGIGLRKPGFITHNQSLLLNFSAHDARPDTYTSRSYNTSVGIERNFNRRLSGSIGLGYKYASVTQADREDLFGLLYLPLKLNWDSTRNTLDPVAGQRSFMEFTPYTDLLNQDLTFTRLEFTGTRYVRLLRRPQIILAGRVTLGTLTGAETLEIPADERYYAGGGGSVRGYSYQSIGPNIDGEKSGGSSLLQNSVELRTRFTETWGFAAFLDGGMVTQDEIPLDNVPLKWGAGAGLRIFTGIGPLRLDMATPLNPGPEHTSRLQFYISLGQAF